MVVLVYSFPEFILAGGQLNEDPSTARLLCR